MPNINRKLNSCLERAIQIAFEAHAGQTDRAGQPYILHPLRVMMKGRTHVERMIRVLHDVLEDNDTWTAKRLLDEGIPPEVVQAVEAMTKTDDEISKPGDDAEMKQIRYGRFIVRCARNRLAAEAKLDDLDDNMDLTRLPEITPQDQERLGRYTAARAFLVGVLCAADEESSRPRGYYTIQPSPGRGM